MLTVEVPPLFRRQRVLKRLVLLSDKTDFVGVRARQHIQSKSDIVSGSELIGEPANANSVLCVS